MHRTSCFPPAAVPLNSGGRPAPTPATAGSGRLPRFTELMERYQEPVYRHVYRMVHDREQVGGRLTEVGVESLSEVGDGQFEGGGPPEKQVAKRDASGLRQLLCLI